VTRIYLLLADGAEIARRRALLPAGCVVEVWPDLARPGHVWVPGEARSRLEAAGGPLPIALAVEGARIPIYHGPGLDAEAAASLPAEGSLRARVLSGHGIAVARLPRDRQIPDASGSPDDPVFFLRRPGGGVAHRWRLFRTRAEARAYMREWHVGEPEARAWAEALPLERHADLHEHPGTPGTGPG
jgi:hypothetical protein